MGLQARDLISAGVVGVLVIGAGVYLYSRVTPESRVVAAKGEERVVGEVVEKVEGKKGDESGVGSTFGARRPELPGARPLVSRRVGRIEARPTGTFRTEPATAPVVRREQPVEEQAGVEEGPFVPLPIAREALALVGADEEAEAVWVAAINDPAMTAHDRSDLIEDLNEVGIDPKNLTPDDLPLIVNRLAMIEALAPDAMDQTNFDAFAEAYKDLVNMYERVAGR